jgi:hypothetical protein
MDSKKIIELLSRSAAKQQLSNADCPGPGDLAVYLEGGLSETQRRPIQAHLAGCEFCIEQVATLSRARELEMQTTLPEATMARAQSLVDTPNQSNWQAAPRWAVAAVVLISLGVLTNTIGPRFSDSSGPDVVSSSAQTLSRTTRFSEQLALQPRMLSPTEGSRIESLSHLFRWTDVPGALYYELMVVSEEGDLLWKQRVSDTKWLGTADMPLQSNASYYVRIDAYVSEVEFLSSEHITFSLGDKN